MNFLFIFILLPLLLMGIVALLKDTRKIKQLMIAGSGLLLAASFILLFLFLGPHLFDSLFKPVDTTHD